MKKKKTNKTRIKIFIALTLMFTLITTIFIGTKTFAYESDKISYTITQLSGDDFTNYETINNNNNYIDINYTNGIYMKNDNTFTYKKYYLCINYILLNNNNEPYTYHSPDRATITPYAYISNTYRQAQGVYYNNYEYNYNGTYYTQIIPITFTTSWNNTITKFRFQGFNSHIRIYNIDIVSSEDLGLSQYYETYYSQIEEQYEELRDDYSQLSHDYTDLENDYITLESNYNNLENEYDTLENEYNDLQQDIENLTQTIDNGLWSYTSGVVALGNGYGASYTTYNDIINANIIKDFTFDCIQTYPTYTQQNNGISGNVFIVMGVLPDENTSNWEEVKYTPANLLNFNVNTNITDYIKITIDLTTINNAYQNRILQINKSNIELMNYEITSEKLEGLFDFEASYYRVERIKIEWTKESNNDYLYLISTNVNYTNGYTLGYYDGLNTIQYEKDNIINNQQEQINNLNNQVHELTLNVDTLIQQIDAFNSDYNLNNLMWTIASTPFESFKQIWNVQFFGVNVSELLLGLITTFIALNIAKRFFF